MISSQTIDILTHGGETKLRAGGEYRDVQITVEDGRMLFHFGYYKPLIDEIKETLEQRRYHGFIKGDERKIWSAPITYRNLFRFEYLQGKYGGKPYSNWDEQSDRKKEILEHWSNRYHPEGKDHLFQHQIEMIELGLNVGWCIWGAQMGLGKTLAAIVLMEMSEFQEYGQIMWVAPKSALVAARAEFMLWDTPIAPQYYTPNALKGLVENWESGKPAPRTLILDESSRYKTPETQRSQAAQHIADAMRKEYGDDCYIIEMSGTPAPKAPSDWWKQCEIACPGFVREANFHIFRNRLAHITKVESTPGAGAYPKLEFWRDSEHKCKFCGQQEIHPNHTGYAGIDTPTHEPHAFKKGINEIASLYDRFKGLVGIWMKSECLDLPEKRYELIELEPAIDTVNAARMVLKTSNRAADALIRLRTLSDGFMYTEEGTGEYQLCNGCGGKKQVKEYYEEGNEYDVLLPEEISGGYRYLYEECPSDEDPITFIPEVVGKREVTYKTRFVDCYTCEGKGEVETTRQKINEVPTPKTQLLETLLEQHEEIGRLNIYAGFFGSILRCVRIARLQGWATIKADGKGWAMNSIKGETLKLSPEEMIYAFQNQQDEFPKLCFIGQPGAAGMGLTLTASPTTFYYSNDFNPESRLQSEDRGHRIGMDIARGGRIIDCVHLPSDRKVIDSLRKSKNLQLLSMRGLNAIFDDFGVTHEVH